MELSFVLAAAILRPGELIAWLCVGLIAGFFASIIIRGRGYGCIGNIVVGLIGAVIGGFLTSQVGINETFHFWGTVLVAFLGACVLVFFLKVISGDRKGA
ncbi:MAG: GlsB/YeaQ/YmgE family stress response membrane protein [Chloroflexota bacterium]|nr:GlsB/YeaQ/YmgE family stress response membrane protein [Chloroflexota bacterium]